jgi:hypothetical protein
MQQNKQYPVCTPKFFFVTPNLAKLKFNLSLLRQSLCYQWFRWVPPRLVWGRARVGSPWGWPCSGIPSCPTSQSRQSAKLFLQSSELGLPQPLTRRRVCPVCPPFGSGGRGTLAGERGGGRVPIPTRENKLWYSMYSTYISYMLCPRSCS